MKRTLAISVVAALGFSSCTWFSAAHPEGRWLWMLQEIGYYCDSDDDGEDTGGWGVAEVTESPFQAWGETYLTAEDTYVVNLVEYGIILTGTSDKNGFDVSMRQETSVETPDCPLEVTGYHYTATGTWGDDLAMDGELDLRFYETYDKDCPDADRADECTQSYSVQGTLITGSDRDFPGRSGGADIFPNAY